MSDHWTNYYAQTAENPPRESLVRALASVPQRDAALDLGAGALTDTAYLLTQGFREVVAVDSEPSVAEHAGHIKDDRLKVVIAPFDSYQFPSETFDLVNAQYSLPFNPPASFGAMFGQLKGSLKTGGVLVGQFFGKNDSWSKDPNLSFHTLEEARDLLAGMEIIQLDEVERDGTTAAGTTKHWDVIQILARKI